MLPRSRSSDPRAHVAAAQAYQSPDSDDEEVERSGPAPLSTRQAPWRRLPVEGRRPQPRATLRGGPCASWRGVLRAGGTCSGHEASGGHSVDLYRTVMRGRESEIEAPLIAWEQARMRDILETRRL